MHYSSDADTNLLDLFNEDNHREFYSNEDYEKVGGRKLDENEDSKDAKEPSEVDDNDL